MLDLLGDINRARIENGVPIVLPDELLASASNVQCEWVSFAKKKHIETPDHVTDTAWLLSNYSDLDWFKLYATYPNGLPQWLGSFDVSRLYGYDAGTIQGPPVNDIGSFTRRNDSAVIGWLRSLGHRVVLLDPRYKEVGLAIVGISGGKFYTSATFGVPAENQSH